METLLTQLLTHIHNNNNNNNNNSNTTSNNNSAGREGGLNGRDKDKDKDYESTIAEMQGKPCTNPPYMTPCYLLRHTSYAPSHPLTYHILPLPPRIFPTNISPPTPSPTNIPPHLSLSSPSRRIGALHKPLGRLRRCPFPCPRPSLGQGTRARPPSLASRTRASPHPPHLKPCPYLSPYRSIRVVVESKWGGTCVAGRACGGDIRSISGS